MNIAQNLICVTEVREGIVMNTNSFYYRCVRTVNQQWINVFPNGGIIEVDTRYLENSRSRRQIVDAIYCRGVGFKFE